MTIVLSAENISKYFGGLRALEGMDINIREGEILGIIGPNGAGKSVLLNLISGVYKPTTGTIHFKSRNVADMSAAQLSRLGIARTFQNIRTFKRMTVLENVMVAFKEHVTRPFASTIRFSRRNEIARAERILEQMHLSGKENVLASSLSYGDARRLEIARALATEPSLLLLDEPAAGMNTAESAELRRDILECRERVSSIVVIEHDVDLLRDISDRMVALDYGRKLTEGAPETVLRDPRVVEAYIGGDEDD